MISLITVNWHAYDFLEVLIESLEIYTTKEVELVVIDNSTSKREIPQKTYIRHIPMSRNIGHGEGLNLGSKLAKFEFVMFLDIDTHFLRHNWHDPLLEMMKTFDVVGGRGVPVKPIRPACMFMKKELACSYDWRPTEGYKGHRITPDGTDVAIKAYHQIKNNGLKIGFLETVPNRYGTKNGEEFTAFGESLVYHHWHGSHLVERQVDFPNFNLIEDKKVLFESIPWRSI